MCDRQYFEHIFWRFWPQQTISHLSSRLFIETGFTFDALLISLLIDTQVLQLALQMRDLVRERLLILLIENLV